MNDLIAKQELPASYHSCPTELITSSYIEAMLAVMNTTELVD